MREADVPQDETKIIEDIISKFVFTTDNKHQNQVDLCLALKALPARVDEHNCHRIEMFDFESRQRAIIACQNMEQDMLFKFYDDRNKQRLRKLNTRAVSTEDRVERLNGQTNQLISVLNRID